MPETPRRWRYLGAAEPAQRQRLRNLLVLIRSEKGIIHPHAGVADFVFALRQGDAGTDHVAADAVASIFPRNSLHEGVDRGLDAAIDRFSLFASTTGIRTDGDDRT